jgi:nucleoid-associated protein YgaU
MGLISFIKDAGLKLFGKSDAEKNEGKEAQIINHLKSYGFNTAGIKISVNDETVILTGEVDTIANKNKIIVAAGNVEGISKVEDRLSLPHTTMGTRVGEVEPPEPEKQFYTVVPGDTLSKISKQVYGNANKYPIIFEANKPMLKHPDKIYPGQVLVIPPLD